MWQQMRAAVVILVAMTILTGGVYPAVVTLVAQAIFPFSANGSVLEDGAGAHGSELVGQPFTRPEYFWGRLSATSPVPYHAAASSGSNFGPLHPDLATNAAARIAALQHYDPKLKDIPVDLVTSSASGLDPHISPAAAEAQVARVAQARDIPADDIRALVRKYTQGRTCGVLGEPRVNVLQLNLALDAQFARSR